MQRQAMPTVTPLENQGRYLITVKRGERLQRKRHLALTEEEARIVLAALAGWLRKASR